MDNAATNTCVYKLYIWFCVLLFFSLVFFFFFFFGLFRAASEAYGGSQAGGPIGAVAAGLHHGHSNQI